MPRFYLTAVAAAVMAATVNAAEFPAIPKDQTDYNEIIYRDDANDPTSYEQSSWNGIGLVASGEPMSSGSKAPALLYKFSAAGVLPRCVGLLQGWKCWQTCGKGRFAALPGLGIYLCGSQV